MRRKIKYLFLTLLFILYFLSRLYRLEELYTFSFDQYRDAWAVKKIIVDGRPTLIGPQSSFHGIFYGPLFYYSLAPFYWLFGMAPLGGAVAALFFGLTTLILIFYVGEKFFSTQVGFVASLIYIFSLKINLLNRDCRNDPPLIAFSLIILLLLYAPRNFHPRGEKNKGKLMTLNYLNLVKFILFPEVSTSGVKSFLLGFIAGLGLHFHFAAIAFLPLIMLSYVLLKIEDPRAKSPRNLRSGFSSCGLVTKLKSAEAKIFLLPKLLSTRGLICLGFSRRRIKDLSKKILVTIFGFIFSLTPVIIFDLRKQFMISKSLSSFLTQMSKSTILSYWQKLYFNFLVIFKNFSDILTPQESLLAVRGGLTIFASFFLLFFFKKNWGKKTSLYKIFLLWLIFPIFLFSFYSEASRDYYFLLNFPIFILSLAAAYVFVWRWKVLRFSVIFFLILMAFLNFKVLGKIENGRSLKVTEEAIEFIKNDSFGEPIFIDYFSKDNFKVSFEYLVFYYNLNQMKKQNLEKYSSYIIFVPAYKINKLPYKAIFGDIGIAVLPRSFTPEVEASSSKSDFVKE